MGVGCEVPFFLEMGPLSSQALVLALWTSVCLEGQVSHALSPPCLECHWGLWVVLPHLEKVPGETEASHALQDKSPTGG